MADELLSPGKGKFYIKRVKVTDQDGSVLQTKKGDRKVMVIVEATDSLGSKTAVFEHLTMNIAWKVKQIYDACKHGHLFISDTLCLDNLEDLEGCIGECIIGRSEPSAQWPEKTIITKYIVPKEAKKAVAEQSFIDDSLEDLPF